MLNYRALYELAKTLLNHAELETLPPLLLRRLITICHADRGFIVIQEDGQFNPKHALGYESDEGIPSRSFSRSVIQRAIASGSPVFSQDAAQDPSLPQSESVTQMGGISVLAVPLRHQSRIYAVIYLESAGHSFQEEDRELLAKFADLAGLGLERALTWELQRQKGGDVRSSLLANFDFRGIIGRHPSLIKLLELVSQVATSNASILIRGETGTGKELIAEALWANSDRHTQPLVTLHCGALPETLFEAELFGHVRGSFTGADRHREGRLKQAHRGTLFIDEAGEIPLAAQAKLLRFLQSGEVQRIGSDTVEKLDVRVIAATHRDLEAMVAKGHFRQDLFYRLNVVELVVPPLRDRKTDIPLLVDFFLKQFWTHDQQPQWRDTLWEHLAAYHWPGNVRELSHAVERVCLLARNHYLSPDLLPATLQTASDKAEDPAGLLSGFPEQVVFTNDALKDARQKALNWAIGTVERRFLKGLLEEHDGHIAKAAADAGLQKTYLYKLLRRHDMSPK